METCKAAAFRIVGSRSDGDNRGIDGLFHGRNLHLSARFGHLFLGRGICPDGCPPPRCAPSGTLRGTATVLRPYSAGMKRFTAAAFLAIVSPLAACSVSVDEDHRDHTADVRILTPVGRVLVRTGREPETGLSVYLGSTRVRKHREAEAADVTVGNSAFGVKVA